VIFLYYNSSFNFIQTDQNILFIQSNYWDYSSHTVLNNTFKYNMLADSNSVIGFLPNKNTNVIFSDNIFKCNIESNLNSTAPVFSSLMSIDPSWLISANSIDPACPLNCAPGEEPLYNGIAGCVYCDFGWISPGGTSRCSPCSPGTYSPPSVNNCTLCPPGTYAPGYNHSYCLTCTTGTSKDNHVECVECPENHYSYLGICHKCTEENSFHGQCLDCGFFTTVESDCKDLSMYGIIVIAVILVVVIISLVLYLWKSRREYTELDSPILRIK